MEDFDSPDETSAAPTETTAGKPAPDKILARLAAAAVLGQVKFDVPEAIQRNKKVKGSRQPPVRRSARTVTQAVKALPIRLRALYRRPEAGGTLPPVNLWVVEAREIAPPTGEEPLGWVLLTTLPVDSFEQAGKLLEVYLCRWEIELLHRVLKSGCKVEQIQQRFDFRIEPVIVLYSGPVSSFAPRLCLRSCDRHAIEPSPAPHRQPARCAPPRPWPTPSLTVLLCSRAFVFRLTPLRVQAGKLCRKVWRLAAEGDEAPNTL